MADSTPVMPYQHWQVLDRAVNCAVFAFSMGCPMEMSIDGWVTLRINIFESYGMGKDTCLFILARKNLTARQILEERCNIKFGNASQKYDKKDMILKLRGTNTSKVPPEWLVAATISDTSSDAQSSGGTLTEDLRDIVVEEPSGHPAAVPPTTPTTTRDNLLLRAHKLHQIASALGGAEFTTPSPAEKAMRQRYFATEVRPAVTKLISDIVAKAEGKYVKEVAYDFLVEVLSKTAGEVAAVEEAAGVNSATTDRAIVDSIREFLQQFNSKGSRNGDEQNAVKVVLTAVSGAVNGKYLTQKDACERLGVKWQATWSTARNLHQDLIQEGVGTAEVLDGSATSASAAKKAVVSKAERNKREDHIDLTVARDFWHEECFEDTWSKRKVSVVDASGNVSSCDTHVQKISTKDLYLKFKQSKSYSDWILENQSESSVPNISLTLFRNARCPCVVEEIQHDCANEALVALEEVLKAWQRHRSSPAFTSLGDCTCQQHAVEGYAGAHRSVDAISSFTQCPAVPFADLCWPCEGYEHVTSSDAVHSNAKHATDSVGTKRANSAGKSGTSGPQYKKVKAVMSPTSSPHLQLQERRCGHQECTQCGVDKSLPDHSRCPHDWSPFVFTIVRVFEDVPRGGSSGTGRKQRELREKSVSMAQLFVLLKAALRKYLPHRWDAAWDLHNRRLLHHSFGDDTIVVSTDFSATMDLDPQHRLNSAISGHAIQGVFIVSHSPRLVPTKNGKTRRVMENDVWHCWGEETRGKLTNDNYFHAKSLGHIINHYKNVLRLPFLRVVINSDGCPTQYKLRKNCFLLWMLACQFSLSIEQTFAPTATFKTSVDGAGNDAKVLIRQLERWEKVGCRASTAREVFHVLKREMPQPPERDEQVCALGSFTRRHHILLVDRSAAQDGDAAADDILVTDYAAERWDCKRLDGIQSVYAIRAEPTPQQPAVFFRSHRCWCDVCLGGARDGCPLTSTAGVWKQKDIYNIQVGTTEDPVDMETQLMVDQYNDGYDDAMDAILNLDAND